ncbi:monovalent cation:proton antiporter-2 (CPA2) family protein [Devosia sp. XJ19-1]|uniref:Monovalent cation:proton antiporter-2 (CPA2) family protein n=1 Tax=Devosia ureilytica TaxID=2952754 RepID=A0A9Q4ARF9_9HYPH|nr:monovalent cation:proton antiporter-2 (CPA2) family protein [Devosia ureilytica]MCP8884643.1 monovalent cation:proton antiporter-2 (CPA2) family protein [Devosia ureilytica]MCP8888273.1 monovalent cation:proton antiporter-2 (CPA2) family protein [Devosia ureilytica]
MEDNILLALFVLLAASAALVPLAKATGLGTVLGYLAAGILIGPYGLKLLTDSDTIRHIAEFGIVLMLFLIGLDLQPREVWRMRNKVLGLGLPQMALTTLAVSIVVYFAGFAPNVAIIVGLAFAMSSTAIAMQTAEQRDITRTDAGRSSLAVLLVQDVAVIPILAIVPLLALATSGSNLEAEISEAVAEVDSPIFWQTSFLLLATFVAAVVGGRYVVRPLLALIARTAVREAFTALALALVIGAALATQALGLSPALGAFIGGVLLADSEYRHELESNLQPFKGLLLGLFFVSVGMSIAFAEFLDSPWLIAGLVLAVIAIKFTILLGLGALFRLNKADRLLVAILLSQAGEFAFVVLQFANNHNALEADAFAMFTVVVALSMATTPLLLLAFDKLVAPRLDARNKVHRPADAVDQQRRIVVLGYGRFGQIVTRMLRSYGYDMTLIDDDAAQIELVKTFGVKVFYGDASRTDLLHSAGVKQAELVIIAVGGADRILEIARNVRRNFPEVAIAARAVDRGHAHELMELGVTLFERETFHSALHLGKRVLTHLGHPEEEAEQLARDFHARDQELLERAFELRNDREAFLGTVRQSMALLHQAMQADQPRPAPIVPKTRKRKTTSKPGKVDKSRLPRSG